MPVGALFVSLAPVPPTPLSLALPPDRIRRMALLALAGTFIAAGTAHFVWPARYASIVPPYLPAPLLLVYASGLFEVLGGLGVLLPVTRRAAGWGLVLLLIAVFPANLHMALHPADFDHLAPAWALWARLPLQLVFIAWALWATRPASS